jgi:hypothetical protein
MTRPRKCFSYSIRAYGTGAMSETSVEREQSKGIYQTTRYHIPQDNNQQVISCSEQVLSLNFIVHCQAFST